MVNNSGHGEACSDASGNALPVVQLFAGNMQHAYLYDADSGEQCAAALNPGLEFAEVACAVGDTLSCPEGSDEGGDKVSNQEGYKP